MADTYAILGFSDTLDGPVVLYESDSCTACDEWRKGYTRGADWGGYDTLALYEIGPDQKAITIAWRDAPIIAWERSDAL
jgi:hypothetical protein